MDTQRDSYTDIWTALEDTPADAQNMKARADILIALQTAIDSWGLSHADAAQRLSVTLPRLEDLLDGRIDRFDLESLIALATAAGLTVEWRIISDVA